MFTQSSPTIVMTAAAQMTPMIPERNADAIARYYEARERARAAGDEVERLQAALDAKQD